MANFAPPSKRMAASLAILAGLAASLWTPAARATDKTDGQTAHGFTLPASLPDSLTYTILMDGDPIGQEDYAFRQDAGRLDVSVQTKTDVKLLFLTFHYRHQRQESWQDGKLVHMVADTDDDGTKHHVEEAVTQDGETVSLDGKAAALPADSFPLSLWSQMVLSGSDLYGVTDAEPFHVSVKDLGAETLTLNGKALQSHHFRIDGDVQRDLWYGQDGLLLQTTFTRRGYPIKFIRN